MGMTNSFSINWGVVAEGGDFSAGWQAYALWPAPVNDDECFHDAGYSDFQSEDENYSEAHWDEQAGIFHRRLIDLLQGMGEAQLLSKPLLKPRSIARFWRVEEPLLLSEQLEWPLIDDNLPDARVRFGQLAELRTGNGHRLYWLGLSPDSPLNFTGVLVATAKGWPRRRVQLDWAKLSPAG